MIAWCDPIDFESLVVIQCFDIMTTGEVTFSQVAHLKATIGQRKKETVIKVLVGVLAFSGVEELGRALCCQLESGFCQVSPFCHQYLSLLFTFNHLCTSRAGQRAAATGDWCDIYLGADSFFQCRYMGDDSDQLTVLLQTG